MKKMLFSAAALLFSVSAMAQAPAQSSVAPANAPKTEREHKVKIKQHDADGDDDRDGDKANKPANHGQNVSAFAKSTTLTGADKGAAVSAVARGGHGVDHDMKNTRSARGEHGHGARGDRATGSDHANGHAGAGHGRGH